jgi:hypothetical protein
LTLRPILQDLRQAEAIRQDFSENHHKGVSIHLSKTKQMMITCTNANTQQAQAPSSTRKKHPGRPFLKAKKQPYGKGDRQRLLCDFTKGGAINTGSVDTEEQTFGKEAM